MDNNSYISVRLKETHAKIVKDLIIISQKRGGKREKIECILK